MDIGILLQQARQRSRAQFAAEFRHPLLVVSKTQRAEEFTFQTETNVFDGVGERLAAEIGDVVEIVKSDRNPFGSRMIIGRARNCDIVLRHASVSKMHAYFRRDAAGRLEILDLGSRNQTRHNRQPLTPNTPVRVEPGHLLQFGDVVTQLVDPKALHELLVQLGR